MKAILATLLCLVLAMQTASANETVRLTNGDWQPLMSKNGPHHGIASHIVTEAFALVGVEVKYGFFPWNRSMKLAQDGRWDGSVIWWDREERHQYFFYTEPVVQSTTVFFHLKSTNFDWRTFRDLGDLRVGGSIGYNYGKAFNAAEETGVIQTDWGPNDEIGLKKLLKKRIDIFPGELMVTYAQIRDTFSEGEATLFTHHPNPIFEEPMYLLLSKGVSGMKQMRDRFNQGLRLLKKSGRYDRILADGLAGKYDVNRE